MIYNVKYKMAQSETRDFHVSGAPNMIRLSMPNLAPVPMPEKKTNSSDQHPRVTLRAVVKGLQDTVRQRFGNRMLWVRAEIAQISASRTGHYYLDLIETGIDPRSGESPQTVAKARAVIWNSAYQILRQKHGSEIEPVLKQGSEAVFLVRIDFDLVHGLGIHIIDLDLDFNLGQLERRKKETLAYLTKEKLLRLNAGQEIPSVLQRLMLIGAPGTAGFSDFVQQLDGNPEGYRFTLDVIPSRVQGEAAALEIQTALGQVNPEAFDAVILLRGGGSRLDLDAFNDRELAEAIARMPLPVLTGIGHETDHTVADQVAHSSLKTPTALAEFVLDQNRMFEAGVQTDWDQIARMAEDILTRERHLAERNSERFHHHSSSFTLRQADLLRKRSIRLSQLAWGRMQQERDRQIPKWQNHLLEMARNRLATEKRELRVGSSSLRQNTRHQLKVEVPAELENRLRALRMLSRHMLQQPAQKLELWQKAIQLVDPGRNLALGYAIPRHQGKLVLPETEVKAGDEWTIETSRFQVEARIEEVKPRRTEKNHD